MKKEYKRWKIEEEEYLKENYPFGNREEIIEKLKVPWPSIKYKAGQLGVNRYFGKLSRKFKYNEEYFEKIDSEDKAYFLGLIYADGNIHIPKYGKTFKLGLIKTDDIILEKFKQYLNLNRPLKESNNVKYIEIHSEDFCNNLIKLGVVPRKSLVLTFPTEEKVPLYLMHHFIRGYFDGDGTVSTGLSNGYTYHNMSILGTEPFLLKLQNILIKNCNISETKLYKRIAVSNMSYSGRKQLLKIKEYLYKDASIYLERKFKKFPN